MTAAPLPRFTLCCPGLLTPPVPGGGAVLTPRPEHTILARFLSRARGDGRSRHHTPEQRLFAGFGLDAGESLPVVAPLTRLADAPDAPREPCLRADPVHLRPGLNGVTLFPADTLGVAPEEARGLVAELAPLFAAEGLALTAPTPGRWYLAGPGLAALDPAVGLPAPGPLAGTEVSGRLPGGSAAGRWRTLLTEAQMTLHGAPVNQAREERGAPPVNSLWLWGGGGALPGAGPAPWARVWADDPLAVGLARHQGVAVAPLPRDARGLPAAAAPGHALIYLPGAGVAAGDLEGWAEALETIVADWLAPLLEALARRRLAAVTLDPGPVRYTAGPRDLGRWWRRVRPLTGFLEEAGA